MTASTTAVFPNEVANTVTTFAPSTATTKTLITGDATDGSVVSGIHYYQSAAAAVTITLKTTIGATTITLAVITTAATANLTLNLLSSTYLPFIDSDNPAFPLKANQTIEMEVNSVASTLSVATIAGNF